MIFRIITLFPQMFDSYLSESILARAIKNKTIVVKFYNPRDFTENKWRRIDRPPYGGGPGLVIEAMPVVSAIATALEDSKKGKTRSARKPATIIMLSAAAKQFNNLNAEKIRKGGGDVIIICGRYEGIDARVKKIFKAKEFAVGNSILTGGEVPAMALVDAISRRIPGVLGNIDSIEENRAASSDVYTRPEVFVYKGKKYKVPKVLLTGNHRKIEEWRSSN
ncbi:MAG: hypothetical protein A3G59_02385 [Candidatus Taylorbacteria bacterium RIFCSPLOWO2_12_FULL_47_20]|uniref:tRNA (guanine-N(1)-)-methyltransferase n=2 Tax=Candidatus Tayloriibacteriota TaxID=1817919 RepID=A0A1G2P9Y0_9BACT|nr:MAG: hypothetical protein A3H68_03770 [Candidatus Taylorbacteria bacterium RIFCSPLOWO2_02_FULL_46_40]OHA44529.1 MAG: hypothetical protein A3G59_02385 [Candidatus Taylorbacteria bacterium RIFCSPLOWO2_12_FULL_47_20]